MRWARAGLEGLAGLGERCGKLLAGFEAGNLTSIFESSLGCCVEDAVKGARVKVAGGY